MKKLIIGKIIKDGYGTCDWCGEKKDGFLSTELKIQCFRLKDNLKLEWLRKKLFGFTELYWVIINKEYEVVTHSKYALICGDCIKQLKP